MDCLSHKWMCGRTVMETNRLPGAVFSAKRLLHAWLKHRRRAFGKLRVFLSSVSNSEGALIAEKFLMGRGRPYCHPSNSVKMDAFDDCVSLLCIQSAPITSNTKTGIKWRQKESILFICTRWDENYKLPNVYRGE